MTGPAMDAVLARATAALAAMEETHHRLATARARVTHPCGLVSVEVDAEGAMTGLWMAESLTGVDAGELGRVIVETAVRAAELVARQRDALLASLANGVSD